LKIQFFDLETEEVKAIHSKMIVSFMSIVMLAGSSGCMTTAANTEPRVWTHKGPVNTEPPNGGALLVPR
jgi:hypothetical protein